MAKRLILAFSIFIFLLTVSVPKTLAQEKDSNINIVLQKEQIVNKDYFATGDTVTLSGTVNGDAYIAGGNVIIEGVVNGDLLAAGGTINIRGKVRDDVRAAGGQIIVTGEIGRNITTVGGSVTIADSAKINGSLTAGTGTLSIFSPIGKEANIGAGQVTIGSIINGDVMAGVGQLSLTSLSQIKGNLTYWSDSKAQIDSGSKIDGKITYNIPPKPIVKEIDAIKNKGNIFGVNIAFTILSFLSTLIIGLLFINFLPTFTKQVTNLVIQKTFQSLGIGFLSILIAPIVFILLLITIIGIPLGFVVFALFIITICISKIFVSIALGQKVLSYFNKKVSSGWTFILGLSIYYFIVAIPFLGFLFWVIAGLTGLGSVLLAKKRIYLDLRHKNLI